MNSLFGGENPVLQSDRALLRPMTDDDVPGLRKIVFEPQIWQFFVSNIANEENLLAFVQEAVSANQAGRACVFVVIDRASGEIAGSTRFANYSAADGRVEIGWTWLGKRFQGTGLNSHCKFLLMQYAFEVRKLARVEFKTDVLNQGARRALLKVGATEEGVLRSHTLMPGGRRRDTIYYSVLAAEWPHVRERLGGTVSS
jgi:RimJ/RimL family protein N-acetyltransferase